MLIVALSMAKNNKVFMWVGVGALALYLYFSGSATASPNTGGSATFVSDSQLQQTESFESFSPIAYPDGSDSTGQRYSIGYGHQIQPAESYLLTATITQDQGTQFLMTDMQNVMDQLTGSGLVFTQGQFDAASDFGYNTGATAKLIGVYQSMGADAVPAFMMQYTKWHPVPGGPAQINQSLVSRRNANVATWNS